MKDFKNIHKHPMFYYVLVAAIAAIWPVLMWGVYVPSAKIKFNSDMEQFNKAQEDIDELLKIDPERLSFAQEKGKNADFDYATAVQEAAGFCSIPPGNYKLSSGIIITSKDQKSQSAQVSLKDVEITKAARFLSTIQLRWSGLQCTKVNVRKKKGLPDTWDAEFAFKYFY